MSKEIIKIKVKKRWCRDLKKEKKEINNSNPGLEEKGKNRPRIK